MAQLAIRYHHVTVTIQDQVAVTHVDQVFANPNELQMWAPTCSLASRAAVTSFTLWIDGVVVEGQVLDAQASKLTRRLSASRKTLEYAGRRAGAIFPIPPCESGASSWRTQALPAENGLVRYVYPLAPKISAQPLESVSVSVDVRSSVPIRRSILPVMKWM
jgi:Ca-activated chloride channel family protein